MGLHLRYTVLERRKDMDNKVKEIAEKLEKGVEELFHSEKYEAYLTTMAKFHNYSLNNSLLIWLQRPDATQVAGYKAWKDKFKRQVRKGETGIKILAPIPHKYRKEVLLDDGSVEEQEIKWTSFRAVSVFDISQTDGEPLPTICNKLTGEVEGYDDLLKKLTDTSPVPLTFEAIEGSANGCYKTMEKRIVIKDGMSEAQTIKTMVHEIAHSILHDRDDGTAKDADRNTREVQAESVAYVVNKYIGLDTEDYSFGYIAGWSTGRDSKTLKESLEVIRQTANSIIEKIA